jgi:hypothetical protein
MLALLIAGVTCIDPASFGAAPDDGKDDAPAIQQAIDAAGRSGAAVCLGKGVFHLERVERQKLYGSLVVTRALEMYGQGPNTVLRMSGSGNRRDWRAIEIRGARGVQLHDFTIDGLEAHDTVEQTHLIDIAWGSHDITMNRMTLGPMRKPGEIVGKGIGGDCVRLLGKPGNEVTDVTISNSTLTDCDRSGVALQRGLRRIHLSNLTITGTGDQSIDFEPTGRSDIQDIVMVRLDIKHHPNAQGSDAIAIGGHTKLVTRRVTLADSKIDGGGVRIIDATGVQLLRNTINFGARKKMPVISILRRGSDISIRKNTLIRPATAQPGPIVAGTHLGKDAARGVVVEDNDIQQETPAPVVRMTSINGVVVQRNRIVYSGGDTKMAIVNISAVLGDVDDIRVSDNVIAGEAGAVIVVGNRDHVIRTVEVTHNHAPLTAVSVRCAGKAIAFSNISTDADGSRRSQCKDVRLQLRATRPTHASPR